MVALKGHRIREYLRKYSRCREFIREYLRKYLRCREFIRKYVCIYLRKIQDVVNVIAYIVAYLCSESYLLTIL